MGRAAFLLLTMLLLLVAIRQREPVIALICVSSIAGAVLLWWLWRVDGVAREKPPAATASLIADEQSHAPIDSPQLRHPSRRLTALHRPFESTPPDATPADAAATASKPDRMTETLDDPPAQPTLERPSGRLTLPRLTAAPQR